MIRKLARFAGVSALVVILTALFSVVDIASRARADELQRAGESTVSGRSWFEVVTMSTPFLAAVGGVAAGNPLGKLHSSWVGGTMVLYPGLIWTGLEYYVDGTNGADTNNGLSWDRALATIQAGINKTVSGQGDRVYIAPKATAYAEALSVAAKDYIGLIGVWGARYGWPDIAPAAAVALTNNNSQGLELARLRLVGAGGSNAAIVQKGNGYWFHHLVLEAAGDGLQLVPGNTDAAESYTASEGVVEDCWVRNAAQGIRFKNPGSGPAGYGGIGPTGVTVRRITFVNITNQDILDEDAASSNDKTFLESEIADCRHLDRNKAVYITLTNGGGNSGLVHGGRFAVDNQRLSNTQVALAAGIVASELHDATGLVDTSAF